ncbi:MAG: hypothetical protein HAW59_01055, partial [Betaproteobacteria bacterium]|nr:hypothetical protein [Betaproteobacteria bacterium]
SDSGELLPEDKDEIWQHRRKHVNAISHLELYPKNYAPSEAAFGKMREGEEWTASSGFYVNNPHMLVWDTAPGFITPPGGKALLSKKTKNAGDARVEFTPGQIRVIYQNTAGNHWFYWPDKWHSAELKRRLWLVNARDAGFTHGMLDMARSENIDAEKSGDIARMPVASKAFFHYGNNVSKNNISPADGRMIITLRENLRPTKIYVKLWRGEPENADASEDFVFVIEAVPNPKSNRCVGGVMSCADISSLLPADECPEEEKAAKQKEKEDNAVVYWLAEIIDKLLLSEDIPSLPDSDCPSPVEKKCTEEDLRAVREMRAAGASRESMLEKYPQVIGKCMFYGGLADALVPGLPNLPPPQCGTTVIEECAEFAAWFELGVGFEE